METGKTMTLWEYRELFKSLLTDIAQDWMASRYYELRYDPLKHKDLALYYNELHGILTDLQSIEVTGGDKYMIMKLVIKRLGYTNEDNIVPFIPTNIEREDDAYNEALKSMKVPQVIDDYILKARHEFAEDVGCLVGMLAEDKTDYSVNEYLSYWFPNLKIYNSTK